MKHVRLVDLAKETGLSVNTVSRALRDMPDIGSETKRRIKEVASRLGYSPNLAASMIRTNRSDTVGVIVTDISNPVFGSMVKGIDSYAKEYGYTIILSNSNENFADEEKTIEKMIERRVDGFLLVPSMQNDKTIIRLIERKIPFVLLGRHFSNISTNYVSNDDVFGGYLAGRHLLAKGHQEFIYITGPLYISAAKERLEGFQQALTEAGMSKDSIKIYETESSYQGGYDVVNSLAAASAVPKSIFCFNDFIAYGAYKALHENHIRIPQDVAVMGYDDLDFSEIVSPALTTIDMSKYKVGRRAMEMLINEIRNPTDENSKKQLIMQPVLVIREST